MLDTGLVLVRLAQYAGATVLFGSSLFLLYALPREGPACAAAFRWPRRLLLGAALLTALSAAAGLVLQTATMAGSFLEALKPASLGFMISGTGIGRAAVVRAAAGTLALVALLALPPGRAAWAVAAGFGAAASVSLGWMGHAAATEGASAWVHLTSDIVHVVAAAAWLGALAAFLLLLWPRGTRSPEVLSAIHASLHGFSGVGSLAVAALLATGLVNSWFLVGPDRIAGLWTTDYGWLLLAKIGLFAVMLMLAGVNRLRLTPALQRALEAGEPPVAALEALRHSLIVESSAGLAVLVLVAWLGTLAPVAAQ